MKLYNNYNPVVSVILPTFNRKNLLKRAINSVLNQTYTEWELLVIDDGSSDGTNEFIENLVLNETRIKYVKQRNMKLPIALNNGIALSAGKYITFIGSDDEFLPEHLKLRVNLLESNPKVDFLHGGVKIIGNPYVPDKNNTSKKIHLELCVIGGTFFGKREVFTIVGGFKNISYSEDSEIFERIQKQFNVMRIDLPTYVYHRETEGSITNTLLKEKPES